MATINIGSNTSYITVQGYVTRPIRLVIDDTDPNAVSIGGRKHIDIPPKAFVQLHGKSDHPETIEDYNLLIEIDRHMSDLGLMMNPYYSESHDDDFTLNIFNANDKTVEILEGVTIARKVMTPLNLK